MKLYNAPKSCSFASQIALIEAGQKFELIDLNLRSDRKLPDGRHLNDVNPKGYVPVLELDDGNILTENVAVLQYIADLNPAAGLAPPAGTLARYRLQEWLSFIATEIHKTISNYFNPKLPADMRPLVKERLDQRFKYVEDMLNGRTYLMGDTFTVADCYLFVVCSWAPMVQYDLSRFGNLLAWQKRVAERKAVKAVFGN